MSIQKVNKDLNATAKPSDEISIGDIFIENRGESAYRIYSIQKNKKYTSYQYEWLCDVINKTWELSTFTYSDSGEEGISTISPDTLKEYYTKVSTEDFHLWINKAKNFLEKGEIVGFNDADESSLNSETALVGTGNKEHLVTLQNGLEQKKGQLEGMERILELRMQEQKRKMDSLRRQLGDKLAIFNKQIEKLVKIITMIELYLGIEEELHQIQEGQPADINEPITFRQSVLYMDEETAIIEKGGLDFQDINKFDEWLLKDKNYNKVFPENKGVICFKPRRHDKDYNNKDLNDIYNKANHRDTYFLIKNGENIYRIFTEKIIVHDRLFPLRNEIDQMFKEVTEAEKEMSHFRKEELQEKAENKTYIYRKLAFFYQGLIDRTQVFHPITPSLSVFKMEECQDKFNFIYDGESALPSGRLSFWDWHKHINSKIIHGSRVVLSDVSTNRYGGYVSSKDYKDRLFYYCSEYKTPRLPNVGLYEVFEKFEEATDYIPHYYMEELESKGLLIKKGEAAHHYGKGYDKFDTNEYLPIDDNVKIRIYKDKNSEYIETYKCTFKKPILYIKYNPKDEVYGSWGSYESHERKNRISWRIEKRDDFVLNYDLIDTESIEFYLSSRVDREGYYKMIPLLLQLKQNRAEELKWEKHFVQMIVDNATRKIGTKLDELKCEEFVWKCIEWWKNKVIMKRPITKDDTLALRMIEKRVLSATNGKLITK